jgi:phosphoribosylamine--glycine ligase
LLAAVDGKLDQIDLKWSKDSALTVVMAANGYPEDYKKGTEIKGLEEAEKQAGVHIFHAGTKSEKGCITAVGGRVLGVTATGKTIEEAQKKAYEAVAKVDWPDGFNRTDIGWRAIDRG